MTRRNIVEEDLSMASASGRVSHRSCNNLTQNLLNSSIQNLRGGSRLAGDRRESGAAIQEADLCYE